MSRRHDDAAPTVTSQRNGQGKVLMRSDELKCCPVLRRFITFGRSDITLRSAQRFSYDHPTTTIAVVSENGPVTIFRNGAAIGLSANG